MGLNMREPGNPTGTQPAHTYPIARAFALVVLMALGGLFLLHHLVFNVSVSGGVH